MPNPTPTDLHHNRMLSDLSIAYRPAGMIGDQVFPVVNVGKQTDNYAIYDKGDWLRLNDTTRAPGETPKEVTFSVSSDTYNARNYALGTDVWYESEDNADAPFAPELDANEFLRDQLMLAFEARVAQKLSTGVGSFVALSGTDAWSDPINSEPLTQVRIGRQAVRSTTGRRPNVAIIPQLVVDHLQTNPELIRAAFPGAGVGGTVGTAELQRLFMVDRVLVPDMVYNTGVKGKEDAFTDVWSTNVYLLHVGPARLRSATFALAFRWTGPKIGRNGPTGFQVYTREDGKKGVTELWTGYHQDEKIVAPELGFEIRTGITGA